MFPLIVNGYGRCEKTMNLKTGPAHHNSRLVRSIGQKIG